MQVEVLRELGPEDLPALRERQAVVAEGQVVARLRNSHHQLAQLLAKGLKQADVALISGFNPAYISRLATQDPAFRELVAHYTSVTEEKFVDVIERMRVLGLSTLDELQARLEEEPEGWSRRELMELAELTLVKPMVAAKGGHASLVSGGGGGVSVAVNFVTATPQSGSVIDVKPEPVR